MSVGADNIFFLIVTPDCKKCNPYIEKLKQWGIKFQVIDGSTSVGKSFCKNRGISGAPNLVIMEGGRFVGFISGVMNKEQLFAQLRKKGVRL